MIAIVNVDKNVRETGKHKYELRINRRAVAKFTHYREEPLHVCLQRAAKAAEEVYKKPEPDAAIEAAIAYAKSLDW